ncbi:hypothetical protein [Nannocystis pusilla]|uniref:hypothetical protein n=1 Tax=Nannocystis pusilla TaxID=889268 RepID=UPI003B805BC3
MVLRTRSFDRQVGSCAIGPTQPLCSEPAIVAHAHYAAAGAGSSAPVWASSPPASPRPCR